MLEVILSENNVILHEGFRLIKSTTTIKNKNGQTKTYHNYNCSFPYIFYKMFNCPDVVYLYERFNRTYITDEEPSHLYDYKKLSLHTRKNSAQKSSKENTKKPWAKIITVSKTIFGDELELYTSFHYELHCNKRDYITNRLGLLEVYLSKRDV